MTEYDAEMEERMDRRTALAHELGHVIVAEMLDVDASFEVFRRDAPGPDERTWGGRTTTHSQAKSDADRRCIGLAGVCGEAFLDEGFPDDLDDDPELAASNLADYLEAEVFDLSKTDAALAAGWAEDDLERTLRLLREGIGQQYVGYTQEAIAEVFGHLLD